MANPASTGSGAAPGGRGGGAGRRDTPQSRGLPWPGVLALAAGLAAAWAVRDVPAALGGRPGGRRSARVAASPRFAGDRFHNPVPASTLPPATGRQVWREMRAGRGTRRPAGTIPVVPVAGGAKAGTAADGTVTDGTVTDGTGRLRLVWYGHASALVEFGDRRVLFDPIFGQRCSPSSLVGPRRLHPVPVPVDGLPRLSAIVISHDHYDHLDTATVRALLRHQDAPFVVPLGVGTHLDRWRVPAERIIELDWGESAEVAGLELTATPARHFSGRGFTRDRTLWSSWAVTDGARRVFFGGDSGYFPGYAAIGDQYGPFDLALLPIGAYSAGWPDIHLDPEQAVAAHLDLRADLLVPVHWATFNLAPHPWAQPADRVWAEAKARGVRLAVPRPGAVVDVDDPPAVDAWWQPIA